MRQGIVRERTDPQVLVLDKAATSSCDPLAQLGEHSLRVRAEGGSGRRDLDMPTRSVEERDTEFLLQSRDLDADDGLCDVLQLSRATEVQCLRDRKEVPKLS
nr:hypothetical protein [Pseudoclavibacter sp. RFBG4]